MQASGAACPTTSDRLLDWYDTHARTLPWRAPPGAPRAEPYRVWLSEVMLQQTTVAAVTPRFLSFVERWPTVEALAAAADEDVMGAWAGLGYYRRARSLIACARAVAAGGGFPATETGLRRLPGIGPYTAAAIAAIAFGERAVVVDGNVQRVVARLNAVGEPVPGPGKALHAAAAGLTPQRRAGDYAQGLMDLGATVCTPRTPRCADCPLAVDCRAYAMGEPQRFPIKAAKPARPCRRGRAFWIERDGAVWLVRRPARGLLGGMRALPDDGWSAQSNGSGPPPLPVSWHPAGCVRHDFTHLRLEMDVLRCSAEEAGDAADLDEGTWWPRDRLEQAGLPTLFARAAQLAMAAATPVPKGHKSAKRPCDPDMTPVCTRPRSYAAG